MVYSLDMGHKETTERNTMTAAHRIEGGRWQGLKPAPAPTVALTDRERNWAAGIVKAIRDGRVRPDWIESLPDRWKQVYEQYVSEQR